MFNRRTIVQEPKQKELEESITSKIICADEYPTRNIRTGDIFVNENNFKTAIAINYPKVGLRWIDSLNPSKIVARDTDFTKPNPIIDEDFSYKNNLHSKLFWESADENSHVDIADHSLSFKLDDAGNHSFAFDFGKPISESWGVWFKLNISQLIHPSSGVFRCFFGLSSKDQNAPDNEHQDFIGLELRLAIVESYSDKKALMTSDKGFFYNVPALSRTPQSQLGALDVSNQTLSKQASAFFSHNLTKEALFVEIIRPDEKHYVINLYSEPGVLLENKSVECSIPPRNLRYICGKNQTDTRKGGSINGTISDIKFYNVVTST